MDVDTYARRGDAAILLEITDREDIGANLLAPKSDEGGGNRYWLIQHAAPGDTVLHYHRTSGAIVGISQVAGRPLDSTLIWAARGTSARGRDLDPYERQAWEVPLSDYRRFKRPTTIHDVQLKRADVIAVKDRLEARFGTGLHFPYYLYKEGKLRTLQAYLAIFPPELLTVFPALQQQVEQFQRQHSRADKQPPRQEPPVPSLFFADEEIVVTRSGQVQIDPEALTRANRMHARLQNRLREYVRKHRSALTPAIPGANVDLAWRNQQDEQRIAEVKSLTESNETHQIRYGLGQVIDYLDVYEAAGEAASGVLFLPRAPTDRSWIRKCNRVGVTLAWPGAWPEV